MLAEFMDPAILGFILIGVMLFSIHTSHTAPGPGELHSALSGSRTTSKNQQNLRNGLQY